MSWIFLIFILLCPWPLQNPSHQQEIIMWNIGQGQWVTWIQWDRCTHFDFGGEWFPEKEIKRYCLGKKNDLWLSHWDRDHWNGLTFLQHAGFDLCHQPWPKTHKPKFIFPNLPSCPNTSEADVRPLPVLHELALNSKSENNLTRGLIFQQKLLLPGDATVVLEKQWRYHPFLQKIKWLVVSHHGSRYSSHLPFLKSLSKLKLGLVSARTKKYGHPHPETLLRFQKIKTPILKTEDWGHIHLLL